MYFLRACITRCLPVATALSLIAFSALASASPAAASATATPDGRVPAHYQIVNLGGLGGTYGTATALNNRGQVVGYSQTAQGHVDPFLWTNGKMRDLGLLDPNSTVPEGYANDVNNSGDVVGFCYVGTNDAPHAFLWRNGKMIDLGTLGGASSIATAVNNRGQVVGYSQTADGQQDAFLWQNGHMTDLGVEWGSYTTYDINNRGQIVGGMVLPSGEFAFVLTGGTLKNLGTLSGTYSYATGINDHGWVVGRSNSVVIPGFLGGFLWHDGKMTELIGPGGGFSNPVAINDEDQTVGSSNTSISSGTTFVIWQGDSAIDLGPRGINAGVTMDTGVAGVSDINDHDQIAGSYYFSGQLGPALFTSGG